jgi:DNA-binding NarL/FixJ family response regulator
MRHIEIFIIEKSEIIRAGLVQLLKEKSFQPIFSSSNYMSIEESLTPKSVIIINPGNYLYSGDTNIKKIQDKAKELNCILIALVCNYYEDDIKEQFDEVLYLNESISSIVEKIDAVLKKSDIESNSESDSILSERENEVVKLIALGYSNKEIANELNISVHTAISHRKNITSKLEVKSSSAITIYALINKIISEDDFNNSI